MKKLFQLGTTYFRPSQKFAKTLKIPKAANCFNHLIQNIENNFTSPFQDFYKHIERCIELFKFYTP